MLKRSFLTLWIMISVIKPGLTQADEPFMPYMNPEGPAPREIQCRIADNGTIYHNGACYFQADVDGSFTVVTGNAKYAAAVWMIGDGHAEGMWTEEAYASHMHGQPHNLSRSTQDSACWENDELSICAW
ncbi:MULTISPECIES: hypothetical protein [unclassified Yoonia]|uniref:hypothetical protein n=1 Tax=unclassified Yoonia TaxID=2629118 RepID=UPI002AFE2449|nr:MULTISPECIES: hypothetical protein [unclassified Yoonia]